MLSQELVAELQLILKEDFGQDLSLEEVSSVASWLIQFTQLCSKKTLNYESSYENTTNKPIQ